MFEIACWGGSRSDAPRGSCHVRRPSSPLAAPSNHYCGLADLGAHDRAVRDASPNDTEVVRRSPSPPFGQLHGEPVGLRDRKRRGIHGRWPVWVWRRFRRNWLRIPWDRIGWFSG